MAAIRWMGSAPPAQLGDAAAIPQAEAHPAESTEADHLLRQAILSHRGEDPLRAAEALARYLRHNPAPRPDALLLHDRLMATGAPDVRAALGDPPATLSPAARAHLAAMRLPQGQERAAALGGLVGGAPDAPVSAAALAQALVAASQPQGPTVALARRIAALLDAAEAQPDDNEARFLDDSLAAELAEQMRGLAWIRDLAARRIEVSAIAPPPRMPGQPMLIRVTPPESAGAVQVARGEGEAEENWETVPQAADDPAPTLRLPPPWRPVAMRFRYTDRDGVVAEPVTWQLNPAQAVREATQRALQRPGPFAFYLPGQIAPGRLNPLPIAGHLRAGLSAIEWFTDADREPKRAEVGIADEEVLSDRVPRSLVEFEVPSSARMLFLTAVFADGTRSETRAMAIR